MRSPNGRRAVGVLLALCGLGALGACTPDTESLDVAAITSPKDSLSVAELRDILLKSPTMPTQDAAYGAAAIWSDFAVVAAAVASGGVLDDPATLDAVAEPMVIEQTIQHYAASRPNQVEPTEVQIDSIGRGNQVRAFRRFVIGPIDPADTAGINAAAQRLIRFKQQIDVDGSPEAALRSLGREAVGIEIAAQPATLRSELPPPLANELWQLSENQMSLPMYGLGGIQIFQRLSPNAARVELRNWLTPVLRQRADAVLIDSIVTARNLAVARDGVARLRAGVLEPMRIAGDAPLVTWDGGDVSPDEARTWLAMMAAPERARLHTSSDTGLTRVLRLMAHREILYGVAVAGGTDPEPIRAEVRDSVRARLAQLSEQAQEAGTPTAWMTAILEGRRPFLPLPGALAAVLRDRVSITMDGKLVERALQHATRVWGSPTANGVAPAN